MTILTSANGSLPLTLRKGETLVIRNYSGVETVTGSIAAREATKDGAVVYGPHKFAASVVITTTGTLDYQIVMGDMTTPEISGVSVASSGRVQSLTVGDGPELVIQPGKKSGFGFRGSMGRQICTWPSLSVVAGDATLVSDVPPMPDGATQSVRVGRSVGITTAQAAVALANYTPATGTFPSIGIWVKNPGTRPLDFRVRLWNAAFSRSIVYGGSARPGRGWEFYTMSPQATVLSTWTFGTDQIAAVRVEQFDTGSNGAWVDGESLIFGSTYADIKGRPRFMLTFDDVPSNVYRPSPLTASSPVSGRSSKQMMDYYGFRGTVFLTGKVFNATSQGATTSDILPLLDAGWSVGSHSMTHPVNAAGDGLRLLGPMGYNLSRQAGNGRNDCRVTSTTASTDTLTCEGNHNLSVGSRIVFYDQVPTGLQAGVTYWPFSASGNTFKLAATESLANAGTAINLTSDWTGAAEYRFAGSANDDSAIYADIMAGIDWISSFGLRGHEQYFALPQGGWDHFVRTAVERAGIRYTRGIATTSVTHRSIHMGLTNSARPTGGTVSSSPHWACGWPEQADAISTDNVYSLAQATAYVDACITNGYTGANYHHNANDTPDVLDGLLAYLKTKSDAGLIDVVTMWDLDQELNCW